MNASIVRASNIANFLLAWVTPWRQAFLTRAPRSGLRFYVHHRDVVGRHIAKYGAHEPALTNWMDAYLAEAPRGLVLDVGANIGWHTLHAASHANVDKVVAFEPDAFNAWLLDRNVSINGTDKVITIGSAVGHTAGTAKLSRYKGSNNGRHSLAIDHGLSSRTVPVTTLDGAIDHLQLAGRPVLLVKIDVEGYEPAVIQGGTATLANALAIVTEFSPDLSASGGLSLTTMVDQIVELGFHAYSIDDSGLTPLPLNEIYGATQQTDIVWLRGEQNSAPME